MPDVVLFDLGGVLTPDPWQTLLLTPGRGLVDSLGLDRERVERAGDALWPAYSRAERTEDAYWADFAAMVGREVPRRAVDDAQEALVVGNPGFGPAVARLGAAGVRWGVISDNTSFWYERQLHRLGVTGRVDPDLEFLSFRRGAAKTGTHPSLFDLAASALEPARTLVIDDRAKNVDAATAVGFEAVHYAMRDDRDGSGLVALLEARLAS